jgi:glycosyltransferase involved in cell wall biosynthesis
MESTQMGEPIQLAVVGVSESASGVRDGVRDHARLLAQELACDGATCELHWLLRDRASLRGSWSELHAWTRRLRVDLGARRPDAIVLHYSVFCLAHRGVPLFVHPTLSALRSAAAPIVTVLHEYAFPWRAEGLRGKVWALSQRAALREVVGASVGLVVTAEDRARWLGSRRWLAHRRALVAPVFSNLPRPRATLAAPRAPLGDAVIGLFGYAHPGASPCVVLDALRELRLQGVEARLTLLGAPGRDSDVGSSWSSAARERGLAGALGFSGPLPAQALSDTLAGCEVLLSADAAGPSSRRGTLAASLASGVPVVAIDGRQRWARLLDSDAALVVAPRASALAAALSELLADAGERRALGRRGRVFAESEMTAAHCARAVRALLQEPLGARSRSARTGSSGPMLTT